MSIFLDKVVHELKVHFHILPPNSNFLVLLNMSDLLLKTYRKTLKTNTVFRCLVGCFSFLYRNTVNGMKYELFSETFPLWMR